MADIDSPPGESSGKSKKKNQKRRNKVKKSALDDPERPKGQVQEPDEDPIEELRQRLADAKLNKDHGLSNKLRKQLWIVQDLAAGVSPRVDPNDEEGQALVREFHQTGIISLKPKSASSAVEAKNKAQPEAAPVSRPMGGDSAPDDKRLKNLNKKLKQIEALKEKQKNGEKLEANQLEKIKSEAAVRQEIKETEELISKIMAEMKR